MIEAVENLPERVEVEQPQGLQPDQDLRIPQYRRDLFPTNLVLSAEDLREFCELLQEANERAKEIEYSKLDISNFDSPEQAKQRINEVIPLEYDYTASNGDSVRGLGIPKTDDRTFPDDLKSIFASNATYPQRAINIRPLNTVEAFLGFDKPSLKIDLQTFPSNPTENRSVINISGRDEDWVISTTKRIEAFFDTRATIRPVLHGAGTYDYFIYLLFLPAMFWVFYKRGTALAGWLEQQPVFFNVLLGVYALLLSLLFARFVFQYARWLFPPMEYYKRSRWSAYIHRTVASLIGSTILLSAAYDISKAFLSFLVGS